MGETAEFVTINDDTMREGLQIEDAAIPVADKLRLLDALGETGARGYLYRVFCASEMDAADGVYRRDR